MADFICATCGLRFRHDVGTCIQCGADLTEMTADTATVVAVTRVDLPFVGHEDTPYWTALVEGPHGFDLVKFDVEPSIGDTVVPGKATLAERLVYGVIGTGVMGRGIAELLLRRGHRVVWIGRDAARLERAATKVVDRLARVLDEDEVERAREALSVSTDFEALAPCDVVIESVAEDMDAKHAVFSAAETFMRNDALLVTNTSGLSLDELAARLSSPERFGGLHFFNPPTRMKLVETVVSDRTSAQTGERLDEIARSLGKVPVRVAATPAFAVNRALMPLINEAVRELEDEVADPASIDEAVRLGLNHPMGPLALADLIGLDVLVKIMDNLAERTGDDTYLPRPLLRELVERGDLGRKTGRGFHEYPVRPENVT